MSGAEAALRGYNAELREGLAELRARREELDGRIREEEAERSRLQGRIWALTERLVGTSESLARNLAARSELDRTIAETEAAYGKQNHRPPAATVYTKTSARYGEHFQSIHQCQLDQPFVIPI
ncbi:uncharacterized protein VSU04_012834 isoform 3-T3 [Chlamydotis macqueenii]